IVVIATNLRSKPKIVGSTNQGEIIHPDEGLVRTIIDEPHPHSYAAIQCRTGGAKVDLRKRVGADSSEANLASPVRSNNGVWRPVNVTEPVESKAEVVQCGGIDRPVFAKPENPGRGFLSLPSARSRSWNRQESGIVVVVALP